MVMSLTDVTNLSECFFNLIDLAGDLWVESVTKDYWNANQALNDDGVLDGGLFPMLTEEMEATYSVVLPTGEFATTGDEHDTINFLTSLGMEYKPEIDSYGEDCDCGVDGDECCDETCCCREYPERIITLDSFLD